MKRLFLILILGMACNLQGHAQYFFNKRDPLHADASDLTSVIPRNGIYYCTAVVLDSSNYDSASLFHYVVGVGFAIFDSLGNRVKDTVCQFPNVRNLFAWNNSLFSMPDNGFIYAVGQDNGSVHAEMMIIRYDSIGNVLWYREYIETYCSDTIFYKILDFKPTNTGEWLALATIACPYNNITQTQILLTKLDSNFNVIWTKEYGDPNLNDDGGKILVEPDDYIITGGRSNENLVQINFSYRAEIIKTDTAGNQQWVWLSDPTNYIANANDIVHTPDGGYVYCGAGDGFENDNGPSGDVFFKGWVEKIDSNRNSVWSRGFNWDYDGGLQGFNVIKQGANGNLYLFGTKYQLRTPDSAIYHYKGWFLTLDANGDSLRERLYDSVHSCEDQNVFYDAKATPDGGWIMSGYSTDLCGSTQINPIQRAWLVKVDSNGCLGPGDPQCNPLGVNSEQRTVNSLRVWPNPATNVLHIESSENVHVSMTSIEGKVLLKDCFVPRNDARAIVVGNYAQGVYFLQATNNKGERYVEKVIKE